VRGPSPLKNHRQGGAISNAADRHRPVADRRCRPLLMQTPAATLAAANKYLARSNKSRTEVLPTNKRPAPPFGGASRAEAEHVAPPRRRTEMNKYKNIYDATNPTASYVVIEAASGAHISHHQSYVEARTAMRQYETATTKPIPMPMPKPMDDEIVRRLSCFLKMPILSCKWHQCESCGRTGNTQLVLFKANVSFFSNAATRKFRAVFVFHARPRHSSALRWRPYLALGGE
jgi:hypothetical protein